MRRPIHILIALCVLSCLATDGFSQVPQQGESFTLDDSLPSTHSYQYTASDHIELLPGFKTEPNLHKHTLLQIDPYGVFPPAEGVTGGPNATDDGVVGSLGGTVDVGSLGEALYSIPIRLPQGIHGIQPDLSISYSSRAGNGLLGWGWDIGGLSAVERTGRTRYHDGITGAVTLDDANDRFLLDGMRLVIAADYGDSLEFRTELDRMCRVVAYKTPSRDGGSGGTPRTGVIDRFKVCLADGRFMEYGGTADSRIEPQQGGSAALCWLLDRVWDRNGNAVLYHYTELTATGEWYVCSIDYTEHAENGNVTVEPEFTVHFAYRAGYNEDPDYRYVAGSLVQSRKLLDHISVVRNATDTELERYSFVYRDSRPRQLYDSVWMHTRLEGILFETDGLALNPTRIEWTSYCDSIVMHNVYMTEQDTGIYRNFPFVGDFNGDGYSDLAVAPLKDSAYLTCPDLRFFLNDPSHPGHFSACPSMTVGGLDRALDWVYAVDLDDDGLDDLVTYCLDSTAQSGADTVWIGVLQNFGGNGFVNRLTTGFVGSRPAILTGDFLGTGKQQLLMLPLKQADSVAYSHPKLIRFVDGSPCLYPMLGPSLNVLDAAVGDFDGDGRTEVAMVRENATSVCSVEIVNGIPTFVPLFTCPDINHANGVWNHVFAGDLNGDGMTDLLYGDSLYSEDYQRWRIFHADGLGFSPTGMLYDLCFYRLPNTQLYPNSLRQVSFGILHPATIGTVHGVCLADFDGDGADDIAGSTIYPSSSNIAVYFRCDLSTDRFQARFFSSNYNGSHHYYSGYHYINCRSQYLHPGSFFGNGGVSFLGLEERDGGSATFSTKPGVFSLKPSGSLNSVKAVTDGLGNATTVSYGYVMQPYQNLGFGVRRPAVPVWAVTSVTADNVSGRTMTAEYRFRDVCHHRDGHGWIGFLTTERKHYADGVQTGREVNVQSLETMGGHAMPLPVSDTAYVFPAGEQVLSSLVDYQFDKVLNTFGDLGTSLLVACPALTAKTAVAYDPDSPGEILSKTFTENRYSYSDGQYCQTYRCDSTLTGTGDPSSTGYSQCEFRTLESTSYCQDDFATWTVGRPNVRTTIRSRTGKPDVARRVQYEYVSPGSLLVGRTYDMPSRTSGQHPLTVQTDFEYYPDGNLWRRTVKAPFGTHGEQQKTVEYAYGPGEGRRLVTGETVCSGELGYTTAYGYDAQDLVDTLSAPNGLVTTFYGDPLGIGSLTVGHDGARTQTVRRWAAGHPLAPAGASYYTWTGSSDGARTLTFFHKTGAELRTVSYGFRGEAVVTDRRYDTRGRLSAVSEPYKEGDAVRWTTYGYDGLDRPVAVTAPDSTVTSYTYDGFVTETAVTAPSSPTRQRSRTVNAVGWTVRCDDASGAHVEYDHFADGLTASATVNGDAATRVNVAYDDARNRSSVTDPDYGTLSTAYDAYGRLVESASPRELAAHAATERLYDGLDRPVRVFDGLDRTVTEYTYNENGRTKGTVALVRFGEQDGPDIQRLGYAYDSLARPVTVSEQRREGTYTTRYEYDSISRLSRVVHPTGVAVRYRYSRGQLRTVTDDDGDMLWRTDSLNAYGQPLSVRQGSRLVTRYAYDPDRGWLTETKTGKGSSFLQHFRYTYDNFGNLASRKDVSHDMEETFTYDDMDRLTGVCLGTAPTGAMAYDGYGRMTSKTAGGNPVFSGAVFGAASKPHALDRAFTPSGTFPSAPQTVSYTGFDKVLKVVEGNDSVVFAYGHDRQRISMEEHVGNTARTKRYVGACEYVTESSGLFTTERQRTYLSGPGGVFAVMERLNGGEDVLHYVLKDNLGSWTTIADRDGNMEQRLSYDAWGNLRDPATWGGSFTGTPMFDRGFTGHEHLTAFGLVNMNGRMYDPVMSSFLSADRYVLDPSSALGFNRYAYCMYNPLRYVDPTGWTLGAPASKTGLIKEYLSDPCYITRQQLREAGIYDIEGGYGWSGGTGTMSAGWMEGDGSFHSTEWGIQTEGGGFEAGAWAIPSSFNPMWTNDCQGYCNYGVGNLDNTGTGNGLQTGGYFGGLDGKYWSTTTQYFVNKTGILPLDVDNTRGFGASQWARYHMDYNVTLSNGFDVNTQTLTNSLIRISVSGISSHTLVIGNVHASAKANLYVDNELMDSKPFEIDPHVTVLNPINSCYIGNASFVIPASGNIVLQIQGGWSVYTGTGWVVPNATIFGPTINANKTINVNP